MPAGAKNFTANVSTDLSNAPAAVADISGAPVSTRPNGIDANGVVDPSAVLNKTSDQNTQVASPSTPATPPPTVNTQSSVAAPPAQSTPVSTPPQQTPQVATSSVPQQTPPIAQPAQEPEGKEPIIENISESESGLTSKIAQVTSQDPTVDQAAQPPTSSSPQQTQQPAPVIEPESPLLGNESNSLVDILLAQGAIDPDRAKQVKLAEIQTGKAQEDIIKEQGLVPEKDFIKARAKYYNIPYVDLENTPVSPEALSVLSQEIAKKFKAFPISVDTASKELHLAMADPLDLSAIEFIEQKTGYRVKPEAAVPLIIDEYIIKRYDTTLSQEVTAALKEVSGGVQVQTLDVTKQSGGLIRQEKISEVVTHILDFAIRARASDVHIEPLERVTRVRYRIDGILQEKLTIPRELHESLVSRIKILSGMKIDEKRIPQDGRFNFKNQEQEVDLRVSTLPTSLGEKIVMRLLKKTGGVPDLPALGLRGRALKNLEDAILRPHGIITICGPTGSGKTTTLYSIIQRLNTPKVNIMTLEDPVEYKVAGVNQVQVNANVGLTFASGLRSFLRQDPNIILVGEIRDSETAGLAVQAALTGHLVFSTLHTTNAAGALPRLLDMGAEPFLLSSSMTAIAAQRVMRKIDEKVKESYTPEPKVEEDIRKVLGNLYPANKPITLYRGKPTPENNNSGYKGRVGIYEVIPVTDAVAHQIVQRAPASEIEKVATQEGMITMKQDGYLKAVDGLTTIEEVLRVAQD